MSFETFKLNDVEYPLQHLHTFDVTVAAKDPLAAPATLRVSFSHHVFSEKWDDMAHDEKHEYIADGERRAFCSARYGCSIELPRIIKYHIEGKAYQSRDGNGILRHLFYAEADGITYPVFFKLDKAKRVEGIDGFLYIISAYQKPDLPARNKLQSIKFARLVHQKCPPKTA